MIEQIDCQDQGRVSEILKKTILPGAVISVISRHFSIYGYAELMSTLEKAGTFRFLIPVTLSEDVLPDFTGDMGERNYRNSLNTMDMAGKCARWLEQKAEIRAVSLPASQSSIHVQNKDGSSVLIRGNSPFTPAGLGFLPVQSLDTTSHITDPEETARSLRKFEMIWDDDMASKDIKNEVIKRLKELSSIKSPEEVYFYTLYNVFNDFIGELREERIIKTGTGIKNSLIWKKLYKFQKDGVLGAIDKIEKHKGCIIADSVGLGKTFEALAIIKYYELRNDRVLVLCPKKLRENWTIYTENDKRNLLAADRFGFDVLNHTDLTRLTGKTGDIDLEHLNWANYDLVVIDESHNFRNNPPRKSGMTRYSRLMKDIIKMGVKTKVLMLSATPVNNRMNDLKNQVSFITEGVDDALSDSEIISIEQTLKKAQTHFNHWLKTDEEERTTQSLLEALNFDYFKLLDLLTIARSRKHIEKYYDTREIGPFPERVKPENYNAYLDTKDQFPPLREINRDIRKLKLSAYAPLRYVLPSKLEAYSRKYDMTLKSGSIFKQMDREESLIHLLRVNLFKRMESSIHSFARTLEKILKGVEECLELLEAHDEGEIVERSIEDVDIDSFETDPFLIGTKIKVLIQDVDKVKWKQELEEDRTRLTKLLREAKTIDPSRDAKLEKLKELIKGKSLNPFNPGNRKVIVFTAYADTARYLYDHMAGWAREELKLHSALVTGGTGGNRSTLENIKKDLNSLLTAFSPLSKEREKADDSPEEQIDILIATDCISEGQNLQDCDYLVNYDIHWNPVRIIQRFGRIDRLGSVNKKIQLVNFWPNMELDEYINLEARVSGRMVLLDISATGEENIIEYEDPGKMNDLAYRRKQLEQLRNAVPDFDDLEGGISITDLTLNDFRMDLTDWLKEENGLLERLSPGAIGVVMKDDLAGDDIQAGVIFCLKGDNARVKKDNTYALAPYFLVYVTHKGGVKLDYLHSRRILDHFKRLSLGKKAPDRAGIKSFEDFTKGGSSMAPYRELLEKAVLSVTGMADEKGVETLFLRGGTAVKSDFFRGIEDFEVISCLIIREKEGG